MLLMTAKNLTKKEGFALSAAFFALASLMLILAAVLFFVGKRELLGFLFVCLALTDSCLAFLFYTLSRRASED